MIGAEAFLIINKFADEIEKAPDLLFVDVTINASLTTLQGSAEDAGSTGMVVEDQSGNLLANVGSILKRQEPRLIVNLLRDLAKAARAGKKSAWEKALETLKLTVLNPSVIIFIATMLSFTL